MKLLILTSEVISADDLRSALPPDLDPAETEIMVVAPALQESPLKFWTSDADEAIARAREVAQETVAELGAAGVQAAADTGESDPMQAIQDALASFPADRILLFTHAGEDDRYREDLDPEAVQERFGLPVSRAKLHR
jgi:hypothetical protein